MARKATRRKAGTKKAGSRKRVTRARSRAASRSKRTVRRAKPRRAAVKARAKAKRPARKRAVARPKPKPVTPTLGQMPLGGYTPPAPISPIEPMHSDPWGRPAPESHDESGMEDDEDEEPM
ncbi:MAG TPA: hypothetical protein VJT32_10570 [bacterium]|nr:hypothetical protein [bacterium]